jgi:hypothetical protein
MATLTEQPGVVAQLIAKDEEAQLEEAELSEFISSHGWTFDEAAKFLKGVALAEGELRAYAAPREW